jgi:KDO2-lipid IV(A) lauroyltransferase
VAAELGKGFMELPAIWFRPLPSVLRLVRGCEGWERVEAAAKQRRPVMLMSPHLGCFELVGLFAATRAPITSLYRPPRIAWLEDILLRGRQQSQARLVPANLSGVKALLAALRRGEIIGLLPDQAPAEGEGVWADFFGRPAFSPTLPARLAQTADVLPLLSCAERLPWGRGYRIRIEPLQPALPADRLKAVQALNRAMEALIRRYPTQYLWSYARYKGRGHARSTAAAA